MLSEHYKTIEIRSLPNSIKCIKKECFEKNEIQRVTIPKSVKSIEYEAFYDCKNLTSVTLLEGLESIGKECFRESEIEEITIPKTIKWRFWSIQMV